MLHSLRASKEGLFELQDHQVIEPDPLQGGKQRYRMSPGIISRQLQLQGLQVCNRFSATSYFTQVETQTDNGPQLKREAMSVMLAVPVRDVQEADGPVTTATLSFAVGLDGTLSQIDQPPPRFINSNTPVTNYCCRWIIYRPSKRLP